MDPRQKKANDKLAGLKGQKKTNNERWLPVMSLIIVAVLAGAGGFAAKYAMDANGSTGLTQILANDGNTKVTTTEDSIEKVVDKVSPSVVSIVTNINQQTIFGMMQQQAAGTGIILSADGYIITNRHVVQSSSQVAVVTNDGTTYDDVKVVGTDPLNDIAYLKINGVDNLKPATIGDSSTTRVGQQVIAIGNALGQYQNTVSSGIISGKGRPVTAGDSSGTEQSESLSDLLQTDAAINPGNSGGPLLNFSGQVIGINTAVASNAEGIGFSIPINATKGTTKMVLAGKGVQHAYVGLRYAEITPSLAKQFDLPVKQGAYVSSGDDTGSAKAVEPGGPADKAGIKDKDIITKINNQVVGESGSVATLIGQYTPGETIKVTYLRDGVEHTVNIELAAYNQ